MVQRCLQNCAPTLAFAGTKDVCSAGLLGVIGVRKWGDYLGQAKHPVAHNTSVQVPLPSLSEKEAALGSGVPSGTDALHHWTRVLFLCSQGFVLGDFCALLAQGGQAACTRILTSR